MNAYKVDLYAHDPVQSISLFIDATNGDILESAPMIFPHNRSISALSLYSDTVQILANESDTSYSLSHRDLPFRVFDMNHSNSLIDPEKIESDSIHLLKSDAVQAQYSLGAVMDYFSLNHGRESFDDRSTAVDAYINYGDRINEAYWYRGRLLLGGGDQVYFNDLVSVDIIGHEFMHGLIGHTANLIYSRESGALNESFADIFGELAEYHAYGQVDWWSGREIALTNRGSFRNFRDPNENLNPDTYKGVFWKDADCSTPRRYNDYCGVHTNSGVQNKWFYILAHGESGVNDLGDYYDVDGVSLHDAAAIAYKNLTDYLWSSADYHDARQGSILAAQDLYGLDSPQEVATTNAWYAVGVGEPYQSRQLAVKDSIELMIDTVSYDTVIYTIPVDTLLASYFEEGWDGWIGTSDDSQWYAGHRSSEGQGSILMRDDAANNVITSPTIDVSSVDDINVSFAIYAWSVEYGEDITIELKVDSFSWMPLNNFVKGVDFYNNSVSTVSMDIGTSAYNSIQFRLIFDGSANTDHVYIDEFIVTPLSQLPSFGLQTVPMSSVWPNPAQHIVHISHKTNLSSVDVMHMDGTIVYSKDTDSTFHDIDISGWSSGLYMMVIRDRLGTNYSPFVKL